jgi:hypothetical protein
MILLYELPLDQGRKPVASQKVETEYSIKQSVAIHLQAGPKKPALASQQPPF